MKIAIFGAGATGGFFAARLAASGHDVSVVARGEHLEAIREHGLTLISGDTRSTLPIRAEADPLALGEQDVVIVGVKATALSATADALPPMVGRETLVVFPQNGMPWWYPVALSGKPPTPELPDFRLADRFLNFISEDQLVGGSIYSANRLDGPGVVCNTSPEWNRIDLGSVGLSPVPRLSDLRAAFTASGIEAHPCHDIRSVIWRKLLANMSGSVIALITGNRSSIVRRDPDLQTAYRRVVSEGLNIAAAHGYDLAADVDVDAMIARIAEHKPSLLQDYEAGRPMEIAQIMLAPRAFARSAGVETPVLDTLAALAARMAADRGLFAPEV